MSEEKENMVDFILKNIIKKPGISLQYSTPLVSSGLMDSLALVGVLIHLERVVSMKIPMSKIQPKDIDTVDLMFETAYRLGKAKK
jgi:acyl carrier protein